MDKPVFVSLNDIDWDDEEEVHQWATEIWKVCIQRWEEGNES